MVRRAIVLLALLATSAFAADPKPVPDDQLAPVLKMVRKQRGEWNWAEVPWLIQFSEAQKIAASEGKPILVATAAQGSICGYL